MHRFLDQRSAECQKVAVLCTSGTGRAALGIKLGVHSNWVVWVAIQFTLFHPGNVHLKMVIVDTGVQVKNRIYLTGQE